MDTEREIGVVPYDALLLDAQAEGEDLTETIFDYADAKKVLASYKELSQRDQDIIWMRHVENMEYSEMAKMLNITAYTYGQKKIHGGFTAEEAKIICQFFGLRFEYLL